jgi:hypothetical protein
VVLSRGARGAVCALQHRDRSRVSAAACLEQLFPGDELQPCGSRVIYDIFEGTTEIQQLVVARAISGMHIQ